MKFHITISLNEIKNKNAFFQNNIKVMIMK